MKVRIRFLSLGLHILIMLAVAVVAVVALFFWLGRYTRHGDAVEVPDVCGLYYLDADVALAGGGDWVQKASPGRPLPAVRDSS